MKQEREKIVFVRLRAEGKSYRAIEAELGISKSTCSAWEKELSSTISRIRQDRLEELYAEYGMMKEARISRIGDTLRRIDKALEAVDFSSIPPAKLLELKLKYQAALREEYTSAAQMDATGAAKDTLAAIQDLYRRTASGETSTDQAKAELTILDHMADGYVRANPLDVFAL